MDDRTHWPDLGLTREDVEVAVSRALKKYDPTNQVRVDVVTNGGTTIYLMGRRGESCLDFALYGPHSPETLDRNVDELVGAIVFMLWVDQGREDDCG